MNTISAQIKEEAYRLGFTACGIAEVSFAESEAAYFDQWIADGYHGGMKYMENYRDIRLDPQGLVEGARSVICVALNYYPEKKQPETAPQIAYYAYGKDYHVLLKEKLTQLTTFLTSLFPEQQSRSFVDSAPILERYWAWKAGLGWIGKNGCLIIPFKGSFFFLGEIVTTALLPYDSPQKERCGRCTSCLEACPTNALEAPKRLNANQCLSYLTIEHKGDIPTGTAAKIGNRLFGCDICQLVCPWNRFAMPTNEKAFDPAPSLLSLRKEDIESFTEKDYNRIFAGSAVKRAKYEGLIRTINYLKHKEP